MRQGTTGCGLATRPLAPPSRCTQVSECTRHVSHPLLGEYLQFVVGMGLLFLT